MGYSWKQAHPRILKKIVYGMNTHSINLVIKSHEDRGWIRSSEIKEYGYGLGILMEYPLPGKEIRDDA
ncbi:hypothetical protein A8F94_17300 [Bacillus sp. FJAT-27225]|uniref:hypothetical protein n=1 Tax=Bacillus sp. FJAT-27225 TaxID=1743144 RepID=UPI00080C3561|nr:hypothetical protein [Bacillus sp. FJAT-27225]OCA84454.1 hypothetical protein A8F94_17300 [Bacillus sp. FJAT-27225]